MDNQKRKIPDIKIYAVPFDHSADTFHQTLAGLNKARNRIYLTDSSSADPAVFVGRLKLDGAGDPEFGDQTPPGWTVQVLDVGATRPYIPAGLVPRDGGGVIAGLINVEALGLACFTGDGRLDESFGTNGVVKFDIPTDARSPERTALKRDRKKGPSPLIDGSAGVLALGENDVIYALMGGRFVRSGAVVRFKSDGQLDDEFGKSGVVTVKYQNENTAPVAIIAAKEKQIIVVGTISGGQDKYRLFIARYNENGSPDDTFGREGFILYNWESLDLEKVPSQMELSSVVLHQDGGCFAAGYVSTSEFKRKGVVLRVSSEGQPDLRFNGGKPLLFQVPKPGAPNEYFDTDFQFSGATVPYDGRLVVGGGVEDRTSGYSREMLFVRFNRDGTLDTSFTSTGWLTFRPDESKVSYIHNLAVATLPDADVIYASGDAGESDGPNDHKGFVLEITVPVLAKNGGR